MPSAYEEIVANCNLNRELKNSRIASQLNLIKAGNSRYNAVIHCFENILTKEPHAPLSLNGLTFAVKDSISVNGLPLTYGLNPPLIKKSESDAAIIKILHDKGAYLSAVTNMDPGGISSEGKNIFYGDVINPISEKIICGGSSAGSAAAVALDWVDFAIGCDHGGSVRIPAAFCSLVSVLLSKGSVDYQGCVLLNPRIDRLGMFSKKLDDLIFLTQQISADCTSTAYELSGSIFIPNANELKMCSKNILSDFKNILSILSAKFNISELKINLGLSEALNIRKIIAAHSFKNLLHSANYNLDLLPEAAKALLRFADKLSNNEIKQAELRAEEIKLELNELLDKEQVIITPSLPYYRQEAPAVSQQVNYFHAIVNIAELSCVSFNHIQLPLQFMAAGNRDLELLRKVRSVHGYLQPYS